MAKVTTSLFGQLVILPIPSQPTVVETLSWLTDVIESRDGTEERHKTRNVGRKEYTVNLPANNTEVARAFNTIYGSLDSLWAVPIWSEAQNLGVVAASQSNLVCDTDYFDFRADSLALLWEDPRSYQILEIQTVNSGSLDLYGTTNAFLNAFLMPVRRGFILDNPRQQGNGFEATFKVRYFIEDVIELAPSAPPQYLSNDIYYDEPLFRELQKTYSFDKNVEIVDEDLGVVNYNSPWTYTQFTKPYGLVSNSISEIFTFRKFLYRRSGKYRSFWMPTFDNNLRNSSTGIITTTLRVIRDDYDTHALDRLHIAVLTSDGTWYPRIINSIAVVSATELDLTLDSSLGINAQDIVQISYLGLYRLDTDSINFNWSGGGVCTARFLLRELAP